MNCGFVQIEEICMLEKKMGLLLDKMQMMEEDPVMEQVHGVVLTPSEYHQYLEGMFHVLDVKRQEIVQSVLESFSSSELTILSDFILNQEQNEDTRSQLWIITDLIEQKNLMEEGRNL